jgi:hypothetical protein
VVEHLRGKRFRASVLTPTVPKERRERAALLRRVKRNQIKVACGAFARPDPSPLCCSSFSSLPVLSALPSIDVMRAGECRPAY